MRKLLHDTNGIYSRWQRGNETCVSRVMNKPKQLWKRSVAFASKEKNVAGTSKNNE